MAKKSTDKSTEPKKKMSGSERGRFARRKGRRGELKVVEKLKALWPDVERRIQDRGAKSDGPDIVVKGAQLDIEVKHRDESALRPAIKDAIANCRPGNTWVAIDWPTDGRSLPMLVMNLDEWIELIRVEREAAERRGFEAGHAHAVAEYRSKAFAYGDSAAAKSATSSPAVEPVQSGTLREVKG